MTIDPVDWSIFIIMMLWLTFLVLEENSAVFAIFGGILGLLLAAVLDSVVFVSADPFLRYGVFIVLIILSILLFTQGALRLPGEFSKEAKR